MQHSVETLAASFDVTLIGPRGCGEFSPDNVKTIECPPSPLPFLNTTLLKGWEAVRKTSFDLVLGGSGLVAPITHLLARKASARSVVLVHGLDIVVDNWIYQRVFIPFLRRHDRVIANSQNTRDLAIDKGCSADRVGIVNPGSTMPPDSLLQQADEVTIVTCGPEDRPGPKSSQLQEYFAHWGIEASHVGTRGRHVERELMDACQAAKSDLLVTGAYTRSRWYEKVLGGTTEFLIHKARIPVLMQHD